MFTLKTQILLVLKVELYNSKLIKQVGLIWGPRSTTVTSTGPCATDIPKQAKQCPLALNHAKTSSRMQGDTIQQHSDLYLIVTCKK